MLNFQKKSVTKMYGSTLLLISVTNEWAGAKFPEKKRYEDVRFNVISITRGWVVRNFTKQMLQRCVVQRALQGVG